MITRKSQFVEMFGDPLSQSGQLRLGDVCSMRAGKFISAKDIHEDGLFPCFGGNGIRGYVDNFSHEGTFPVVGRQGALCGNVQLAKGKFYATEHAVVVKPTKNWNPVFMFHLLIGLKLGRLATGAAQPGLAVNKIEEVQVSLPKMELQGEFAAFIEQLDKSVFATH